MTVDEICVILLDKYSLSDLEFGIGATIEDLVHGLEPFVTDFKEEIELMIEEDAEGPVWDN